VPATIDLSDYLPNEVELSNRVARAESRALRAFCRIGEQFAAEHAGDTLRVGTRPSYARCEEDTRYGALSEPFAQLVFMIDAFDGYRARRRRAQMEAGDWQSELVKAPPPIDVPQSLQYRRAWLFGAHDIPLLLVSQMPSGEVHAHVEAVRYRLMELALAGMHERKDLWFFPEQELWQVRVSVMDAFRTRHHRHTNRVKVDDRSVHGRPNRDRNNGIPLTSI